jgi:hypothetical protein
MTPIKKEELELKILKWYYRLKKYRRLTTKYSRESFWGTVQDKLVGGDLDLFLNNLHEREYLEIDARGQYSIAPKGVKAVKRNWLYTEKHWYDADIIRKWSFILSVTAFIVSIAGPDNIRSFITYLFNLAF